MERNYDEMLKKLGEALDNITPEDKEKYFPADKTPKGWLSIEDHLPMWMAVDAEKGYSEYKVKYSDGLETTTRVTDHALWYYMAKDAGVTHWFNP